MVFVPVQRTSPAQQLKELFEYVGLTSQPSSGREMAEKLKSGAFRPTPLKPNQPNEELKHDVA